MTGAQIDFPPPASLSLADDNTPIDMTRAGPRDMEGTVNINPLQGYREVSVYQYFSTSQSFAATLGRLRGSLPSASSGSVLSRIDVEWIDSLAVGHVKQKKRT